MSGFSDDIFLRGWDINQSPNPQTGEPGVAIPLALNPKSGLGRLNRPGTKAPTGIVSSVKGLNPGVISKVG